MNWEAPQTYFINFRKKMQPEDSGPLTAKIVTPTDWKHEFGVMQMKYDDEMRGARDLWEQR